MDSLQQQQNRNFLGYGGGGISSGLGNAFGNDSLSSSRQQQGGGPGLISSSIQGGVPLRGSSQEVGGPGPYSMDTLRSSSTGYNQQPIGNPNPNTGIGYGIHNNDNRGMFLDQTGRLDNSGGLGLGGYHNSIPGGQSHNSEFILQKDDFPVLSSAHNQKGDEGNSLLMSGLSGKSNGIGVLNQDTLGQISLGQNLPLGISQSLGGGGIPNPLQSRVGVPQQLHDMSGGITTGSSEGRYGLAGLLDVIRMTDRDLSTLALGADLTTFGLNLNSADCLYTSFTSPFAESNAHNEPQFTTPPCYLMPPPNFKPEHLSKFQIETLFYMFYSMPRDILQAFSSQELYRRDWRYHAELRIWLKQRSPQEMMQGHPGVQFVYFDVNTWEARLFTTPFRGNIAAGLLTEEQLTSNP